MIIGKSRFYYLWKKTFLFFEKAAAFCGNAAGVAAKEEKVQDS